MCLMYPCKMDPEAPFVVGTDDDLEVILIVTHGIRIVELWTDKRSFLAVWMGYPNPNRLHVKR